MLHTISLVERDASERVHCLMLCWDFLIIRKNRFVMWRDVGHWQQHNDRPLCAVMNAVTIFIVLEKERNANLSLCGWFFSLKFNIIFNQRRMSRKFSNLSFSLFSLSMATKRDNKCASSSDSFVYRVDEPFFINGALVSADVIALVREILGKTGINFSIMPLFLCLKLYFDFRCRFFQVGRTSQTTIGVC